MFCVLSLRWELRAWNDSICFCVRMPSLLTNCCIVITPGRPTPIKMDMYSVSGVTSTDQMRRYEITQLCRCCSLRCFKSQTHGISVVSGHSISYPRYFELCIFDCNSCISVKGCLFDVKLKVVVLCCISVSQMRISYR